MRKVLSAAIAAVAKYGPTPVVAITLGGLALMALAVKADSNAVVAVTLFALIAYIYGQERSARWRKQQLLVEYEHKQRVTQPDARRRVERRLRKSRERDEPSLFPEEEQ